MTEDQARKLAQRFIDTWPTGPKGYIWRDVFLPLDADYAAQAYRALLEESQRAPTPARFKEHYAALTRSNHATQIHWTGNEISLDEYLSRLGAKAAKDNTDAGDELDDWQRWLNRKTA